MTLPVISHTTDPFPGSAADAAVLVIPEPGSSAETLAGYDGLTETLTAIGYKGTAGAYARVHLPAVVAVPLAVVSAGPSPSAQTVRDAVATAVRSLTGFETVAVGFAPGLEEFADAAAEGALLGGYRFDDYRSKKKPRPAATIVLHA